MNDPRSISTKMKGKSRDPAILAFDTSGGHCAGALLIEGRIVAQRFEEMRRGQAERLFPLLEELLDEARATWTDLDAIGVGTGPGNFTGIRISVAAARGLALSLKVPAIGVSGFDIVAAEHEAPGDATPGTRCRHDFSGHARLPGPRGTVYQQRFEKGKPVGDPEILEPDADGTPPRASPVDWSRRGLPRLLGLTAERYSGGTDFSRPAPLYVRPADAAPPRAAPPRILP